MLQKNKENLKTSWKSKNFFLLIFGFLFVFFLYPQKNVLAENSNQNANTNTSTETNQNSNQNSAREENVSETLEEKREDLSKIEEKIRTYEKILEIKRLEQNTLSSQVELIDGQIGKTQEEIKKYEQEIKIAESEIEKLNLEIEKQDKLVKAKKEALKILINDLYKKEKRGVIEILLTYSGISSFIQEIAYSEQANQKFTEKLKEINGIKIDLENKRAEQDQKRKDQESSRTKSLQKAQYLEGEQTSKEKMLSETAGEESKYQEMLKRFEAEKETLLGDLDELSSSKSGELNIAQSNQAKPTSGLASTDWYFSQRDSRWGGDNIGFSNTKMSKYGCAVTSVSMVLKYHGVSITPGLLARQPIFSNDLIVWPEVWQFVRRVGGYSHGNIDWKVVDQELGDHNPVIIFVRANGRGAGHYVVVHHKDDDGKYVVHDPYWGPNIFLNSTRENIGVLYGSNTSIDQMIIYHNTKRSPGDLPAIDATQNNVNSNKNSNKNKNANKNQNSGLSSNEYDKISEQINSTNSNKNSNNNKNKNKNGRN